MGLEVELEDEIIKGVAGVEGSSGRKHKVFFSPADVFCSGVEIGTNAIRMVRVGSKKVKFGLITIDGDKEHARKVIQLLNSVWLKNIRGFRKQLEEIAI